MADADLLGALDGACLERALPQQPRQGSDRALDRLRSADPDRLRPRLTDGEGRGRQGRCAGESPRRHAHVARRHPARTDEHVDDDQRHRGVAAGAVRRQRRGAGHCLGGDPRDDAERHRQGVPVARYVHLPARSVAPTDRRHDRVVRDARAGVEPDQRVLVPPAGGGRHAGAGDRLLDGDGDRRARRSARLGTGRAGALRPGLRLDLVLRQRRDPIRRGDLQAAGDDRDVGPHRRRALRRRRSQGAPVPIRRAGQLVGPDRVAAREQRATDRARDARRDAVEAGPGPVDPAAGVERGARSSPPMGSAVVVANATGACIRVRCSRIRRHLRRIEGRRGAHRRAPRCRAGRARRCPRPRRRVRGGRRVEVPAGDVDGRAHATDRVRRADRRRCERLRRDRGIPVGRRPARS